VSTFLLRASARDLAIGAILALVAAMVLDATSLRGFGDVFVALSFGFAVGLGVMALLAWQRQRAR